MPLRARFTDDVLRRFVDEVNERRGTSFDDYASLHAWSIERPDEFWESVWDFYDLRAATRPARILAGDGMRDARWFEGARLNYADQVLRHRDRNGDAVVAIGEGGRRTVLSWAELADQTEAFAATLRRLGVGKGDRVVGYLTNATEAIVALLGTASLGAVWAGCAPDYGAAAAASRLRQLRPTVLVAVSAYRWNGELIDRRDVVDDLVADLQVQAVIAVEREGARYEGSEDAAVIVLPWDEAVTTPHDSGAPTEQVEANDPLWILFSSGTTGVPKGIVHGHAGVITTHAALLGLQHNLDAGDTLFWYTTTNWMLWNIVVSALTVGATTVTYEGSPAYPGPDRLWQIVADEGVTLFGTSPGHLQGSRIAGLEPAKEHRLSTLNAIAVTGAPAPVTTFEWVREHVGEEVPLLSVCGGTDIVGAFIGPSPWLPVYDGELSGAVLGVDAAAFDVDGNEVFDTVGELVVRRPYPAMPVFFWDDPSGERYRAAYYDTYPGVWRQGDWATHSSRGTFVIHGRSDSTLNRNGVRFGSADIYEIVERDRAVAEALVLGVERADGSYRMPMFVAAAPGHTIDGVVLERLRTGLRTEASPRHVPDEIHIVEAIPHTRTGKKLEVPLKRIMQGAAVEDVLDLGAVDRPELIDGYARLAQEWDGVADHAGR